MNSTASRPAIDQFLTWVYTEDLEGTSPFYGETLEQVAFSRHGYLDADPAHAGNDSTNDCPLPTVPPANAGGAGSAAM